MTTAASGAVVNDDSARTPDPPTSAHRAQGLPAFIQLHSRTTLRIPLVQHPKHAVPEALPPGSSVRKNQLLITSTPSEAPAAIAPIDGSVGQRIHVKLLHGTIVPAVELHPATPSPPEPAPPEPAKDLEAERAQQQKPGDPKNLAQFVDRLRAAGIHADRRACPDLLAQLISALDHPVDTIICTTLDGDPLIPLNTLTATHSPRELCAAVRTLAQLTGAQQHRIVIDDEIPSAWQQPIRTTAKEHRLQIATLSNDYPTADPTILLHRLLRKRLRPQTLPTSAGVLLLDAPAAAAIGRLLIHNQPMTHLPLAIHDRRVGQAHLVTAPVGMTAADLLQQLDLPTTGILLRRGELLRDQHTHTDTVITAGELVLHLGPQEPDVNPDPCIRCGWCIDACPTRIHPAGLLDAAQQDDLELAAHYGLESCIQCGICTYVCPSRLPLLQGIRSLLDGPDVDTSAAARAKQ